MTTKRFRPPAAKDGELRLVYGKLKPKDPDDVIVYWGDGAGHNGADSALLFNVFCHERYRPGSMIADQPLVKLLEERGYDLNTMKFSIKKKQ